MNDVLPLEAMAAMAHAIADDIAMCGGESSDGGGVQGNATFSLGKASNMRDIPSTRFEYVGRCAGGA